MAANSTPAFSAAIQGGNGASRSDQSIRTAIIPVGGLGTRMLPGTMSTSKNMLTAGSKTLIQYAAEEALAAGCDQIVIVCGPDDLAGYKDQFQLKDALVEKVEKKEELAEAVSPLLDLGARIHFEVQEEPLGLGHAIYQAREFVHDAPFAVILPDDLILDGLEPSALPSMVDAYQGGLAVAAMEVAPEDTYKYGIFRLAAGADASQNAIPAVGMVEKPPMNPPSNFAAIGRYILPPAVMDLLAEGKKGAGNEIQLTDAIDGLVGSGQEPLFATRFRGERFDCGDKLGRLLANKHATDLELELHYGMELEPERDIAMEVVEQPLATK